MHSVKLIPKANTEFGSRHFERSMQDSPLLSDILDCS